MSESLASIARLTALALVFACVVSAAPARPAFAQSGLDPSGGPSARDGHGVAVGSRASVSAAPATPQWPAGDLPDKIRELLVGYYGKRALPGVSNYTFRAPRGEAQKTSAWKDPDTLWEYYGGDIGETSCHGAVTDGDFIDCTGFRLTRTFGLRYLGDLTLFDASRGFYTNDAYAQIAGYYAL